MASKMLSSFVPSPTTDPSSPARRHHRPNARTGSITELATPAVTRTAVSLEYASLRHTGHCPLGMYVTPSPENLMIWDAVFFVHQGTHRAHLLALVSLTTPRAGYYTDSILKFRLIFPANYPERPPTVQFLTDVFHPLISQQDGSFNLAPRFRPWKPKEHHVFDVLHWVKAAFKKHALDDIREGDCFNKEAYRCVSCLCAGSDARTLREGCTTTRPPPSLRSPPSRLCSRSPPPPCSTRTTRPWPARARTACSSRSSGPSSSAPSEPRSDSMTGKRSTTHDVCYGCPARAGCSRRCLMSV